MIRYWERQHHKSDIPFCFRYYVQTEVHILFHWLTLQQNPDGLFRCRTILNLDRFLDRFLGYGLLHHAYSKSRPSTDYLNQDIEVPIYYRHYPF